MYVSWNARKRVSIITKIVTTSGINYLGDYLELKNHMDHGTDIKPVNI